MQAEQHQHRDAALARNGDIARVALGRVPLGPNLLQVTETTMAILRAGGVPDQAVAWAVDVVGLYVAASAVESAINTDRARTGESPTEYYDRVNGFLASIPRDRLPNLFALSAAMGTGTGPERFEFGLKLLVDGLAALVPSPSRTTLS